MNTRAAWAGLALAALAGCAGGLDKTLPLADGEYAATSSPDEEGATGRLTIVVDGGRITAADFTVVQADGSPKDESYGLDSTGQVANADYYEDAQAAVAAFAVYARQLVEVGFPDDVDVISGATWAHDQFVEAATAAIEAAQAAAA
jgi:major membrane immunogen (membrane-anchored lipoprotein)